VTRRFTVRKLARFGLAGLANSALTYFIYLLALLVFPYAVAYSIAFTAGIAISYVLNTFFVFQAHAAWRVGSIYGVIYVIQYGVGLLSISLLVEVASVNERLAPLLVIAVIAPLNYLWVQALVARTRADGISRQTSA
jgi:putative flippase GtrA